MTVRAADRLIVAFDSPGLPDALRIAKQLRGLIRYAKIGSILFTAEGPRAVSRFRALGFGVFLDLKFHDIPNTVELSCRAATRLRPSKLTVHAKGRRIMLEAAVRGVHEEARRMKLKPAQRPRVLAVTVLTSEPVSPTRRAGQREIRERVFDLVDEALEARCDGVVASAQDVQGIRRAFPGERFEIVCPGIRPSWACRDDQRRIATPAEAMARGADFLVVGRPITGASDPRSAAQRVLGEMEEGVDRSC